MNMIFEKLKTKLLLWSAEQVQRTRKNECFDISMESVKPYNNFNNNESTST